MAANAVREARLRRFDPAHTPPSRAETPFGASAVLLTVPEDLALYVASYLGGQTLGRLGATSKACGSLYANEVAWETCMRARWHDPRWLEVPSDFAPELRRARRRRPITKPRVNLKQCGASSWSSAYRELHRRNAPPRSWLTPRHAKVVARGRQGALSAWVLVQHTPDCRCVDGTVTLRVVVQNVGTADLLRVDTEGPSLLWLVAEEDNANAVLRAMGANPGLPDNVVAVPHAGTVLECKQVARGHTRHACPTMNTCAWLQPLEWVALTVKVCAPDCTHEHDFLERAIQLCLKARDCSTIDHPSTGMYLKMGFIDAGAVHRMYSELPGGYVVLAEGV